MVIACLAVLIPLFVFGWALNGYANARNTAVTAARYAAWERTVWFAQAPTDAPTTGFNVAVKTQARIEADMVERVFQHGRGPLGQPDAIRSYVGVAPTAANSARPAGLQTYRANDSVIDVERATGSEFQGTKPRLALSDSGIRTSTGVVEVLETIGKASSLGGGTGIDLESRGLWKAEVSLKTNGLNVATLSSGAMSNLPAVRFDETAAVLSNTWSVGGAAHEETRVKPLVPMSILAVPFVDKLLDVLGFLVAPLGDFDPGVVKPDILPTDRRR